MLFCTMAYTLSKVGVNGKARINICGKKLTATSSSTLYLITKPCSYYMWQDYDCGFEVVSRLVLLWLMYNACVQPFQC